MAGFSIGQKVTWKKQECTILSIEKGEKTNKIDYQNGVMPNGFKSKAKKYVLSDGSKVTGNDLINHAKHIQKNEH